MTLTLSNVILHQIVKQADDSLNVQLRDGPLPLNEQTENLMADVHRVYHAKAGKGFALFDTESEFQQWLKAYRADELDFQAFSERAVERLRAELAKYPFADSGTLVMAHYRALATDYVFIGVVESKHSLRVTDELDVNATEYLDVSKMDIAARIDLSTWETDPASNRYLSFIKGRVGRKVADFFLDFLQAEVGMDSKQQNQVLMQAVEDYCDDARLDKEEKNNYRKQVYDYCNDQLKAGDEVVVKELAEELPATPEGTDFYQYTNQQGYELEAQFPADRTTMRKLTKFVGSGGGLSVNFDAMLMGERVFYDPDTDTLTIKGTPPNLRDQLQRRLSSRDDE
ncbi:MULTISPECIES: nucleoid-associated protein YejK [unclassified Salinivibrio]|uniref:nucleoid-associated protein YejK n=1 Tax=unclassified Salinivibrio TaxID=2636825 RepID=UPI0009844C7C|nr:MULTISPECIES: nucleoid-associated protein YejK [unclassified Salinivibrio]NUY56401.1 nucleoid-associated protein YejK [Salinivibrio sp. EAGSL]OOE94892.1 nucleoid-associated protein YejK [Salinivibrio sp. AR640]